MIVQQSHSFMQANHSRMNISGLQHLYGSQAEDEEENQCGQKKRKGISGYDIFSPGRIHAHNHQAVGPVKSDSFIEKQHSKNTSHEGDSNGNGEASNHHR